MKGALKLNGPLHRARSLILTAVLLGLASSASACTSGGSILGTRDSACFRALPVARRDVGTRAKFAGVRHLPSSVLLAELKRHHPRAGGVPEALEANRGAACLVAFEGHFVPASVGHPWAPHSGPYRVAVVIVDEPNDRVLATVLLRSTPLDFTHHFVFDR
jgi:hypothetical protein